jgi:hypothetical protein
MPTTAEAQARETYKKMCEDARKVNYQVKVMIEYNYNSHEGETRWKKKN